MHLVTVLKPGDARIVDDDVQHTMLGQYLLGHPLPVRFQTHVEPTVPGQRPQSRGNGGSRCIVNIGQIDQGSFGNEGARNRLANAPGGSGGQGRLVLQSLFQARRIPQ